MSDLSIELGYDFQECLTCGVWVNVVDLLAGGYPDGPVNTDWKLLRNDIEKFIPILSGLECVSGNKGVLVDVGCSTGYLLWLAKLRGWKDAVGVDVKQSAADAARELFGVQVNVGEFEKFDLEDFKADCIVFHHGIEHVREPKKAVEKALDILTPDGIIYFQHPVQNPNKDIAKFQISSGHQHEWTFKAFDNFIQRFPVGVLEKSNGGHKDGLIPASQTWIIAHENSDYFLPRD